MTLKGASKEDYDRFKTLVVDTDSWHKDYAKDDIYVYTKKVKNTCLSL